MTRFSGNMQMMKPRLKKQKSEMARRGWSMLRLALLWVRKGGVLKNKIVMDLRVLPKYFKNLGHHHHHRHHQQHGALHYGDRELSFDETPVVHLKMHRPASLRLFLLPCMKPSSVGFDYDFASFHDDDDVVARKSFLMSGAADDDDEEEDDCYDDSGEDHEDDDEDEDEEDEIDVKAEKFIAKFREQMKMQRQISYLEYNEMLNRGVN